MAKGRSTVDELTRKKILSDMEASDQFTIINKDPQYSYYFASKNVTHPQSVDKLKRIGYEVVNQETNSGEEVPMGIVQEANGGAVQTAGHILMRMPVEHREIRREHRRELDHAASSKHRQEFEDKAREAGAGVGDGKKTFIFGSGLGKR